MCTSGALVHRRPLPSFSTRHRVPLSATAKLTPESPTRTSRKRSRSTRPAPLRRAPQPRASPPRAASWAASSASQRS